MANSKSAAKRARQTPRRTLRNRSIMSRLRSLAKGSATNGKAEDHRALISALDKAAKRGVIHRQPPQGAPEQSRSKNRLACFVILFSSSAPIKSFERVRS